MKNLIKFILFILMGITICTGSFACNKSKMYNIDFSGQKYAFTDAKGNEPKDKYRAGEQVTLHMRFVATDTNYEFFVDGERYNPDFTWETGFIINFVMPDHDVKINYTERNTMLYDPHEKAE